jgi:hypothetical protein
MFDRKGSEFKPDFVGSQEDVWHIGATGLVTVQSELTLMKGPQGVSAMPITLPYTTGILTSVLIGDTAVPFEPVGAGQFKLQLPLDKLLAGQTKITCTWTLVCPDLEKETASNVPLKSLIPVVFYKLALARYRLGNASGAVPPLRQAAALNGSVPEVYYLLGLCLRIAGNRGDAEDWRTTRSSRRT